MEIYGDLIKKRGNIFYKFKIEFSKVQLLL